MAASSEGGDAPTSGPSRAYKLVSVTYREQEYPDSILLIDESRSEIELRQRTGRRKKGQAAITKLHLEPTVEVLVDGPVLRLSGLAFSFESPARAGEVAEILRRPGREREAARSLSETEAAVTELLVSREQAVTFLSRLNVNPREALLGAESMWAVDDTNEPIDAVYANYSARLAEALEKMASSLAGAQTKLGPVLTERLYALAVECHN